MYTLPAMVISHYSEFRGESQKGPVLRFEPPVAHIGRSHTVALSREHEVGCLGQVRPAAVVTVSGWVAALETD